jgi:molecular chaperone DnaK
MPGTGGPVTYALGIDVGTSYTAAATWRDGRASTASLGDHSDAIPSVVLLRSDGVLLVGEAAARRGVLEPERLARGFKRRMGDPTALLLGEEVFKPEQLTGNLIRWVVETVSAREGGAPDHVTLTCPAGWGDVRRDLLTAAASEARLTEVGLLTEPVAAAVHYAALERIPVGATVAVYDFGGGTFDVAVVEKTAGGYELRGDPGGLEDVGGENVDEAVMNHVAATLGRAWLTLDLEDESVRSALAAVREAAVAAKETLSQDVEAVVPVILPGLTRQVRMTRSELESAIRVDVLKTVACLADTVESAGLDLAQLHAVLLTGGSSRIPLVSELLNAELGVRTVIDAHPKYAVCLGAAVTAAARVLPVKPEGLPAQGPFPSRAAVPPMAQLDSNPLAAEARRQADEAAGLLAPGGSTAAPDAVLEVHPADVGLHQTVDVAVAPRPVRGALRHLTSRDSLIVEYRGNVRRGALVALVVLVSVLGLVAALAVLTTLLR